MCERPVYTLGRLPFFYSSCSFESVILCGFDLLHQSEGETYAVLRAVKPTVIYNEPDDVHEFQTLWNETNVVPPFTPLLASVVQCLEMTTKRKLIGRLVPCRCFRGEEEVISVLDYSHCSLQQVPKEIFSFERTLEELYLDANQIEELPKVTLKFLTSFCWNVSLCWVYA